MATPRPKRIPPFSLRLTQEERAALKKRANDIPLGTFIRSSLFNTGEKAPVDNRQTLAQIPAKLGGSAIAANLNAASTMFGKIN